MEVLRQLWITQEDLENALMLESTPTEVKETKEGKRLLKYLRRRRRVMKHTLKILNRY